jgi:hypothetical protein
MEGRPRRTIPGNGHDPLAAVAILAEIVAPFQPLPPLDDFSK